MTLLTSHHALHDSGEDFALAAVRECQEEAGVLVELTGVSIDDRLMFVCG